MIFCTVLTIIVVSLEIFKIKIELPKFLWKSIFEFSNKNKKYVIYLMTWFSIKILGSK